MKNFARALRQKLFSPPYEWLPWVIWLYVAACSLILRGGGVYSGHLLDFDDHTRMVEILKWVNGAGWYDRTLTRVNAPEGFTSIWSRLVDIPFALVILLAQNFVAQKKAALIAATVVPMAELAVLFAVMPWFARPLLGKRKARLSLLFLLFSSILNLTVFSASGFFIGQASHHAWYVILDLVLFGAAGRIAMGSARRSAPLWLGGASALLAAIGIEGLPMIAATAAILGIVAWGFARPRVGMRGAAGMLCGACGALLLVPAQQPPAHFFAVSFAEPSILGPILIGAAALFLYAEALILAFLPRHKIAAGALTVFIALLLGAALLAAFPDIRNGAAAGLSPAERQMALNDHPEAQPLYIFALQNWGQFIRLFLPLLLAFVAGIYAVVTARGRRRRATALCYFGFALFTNGMSERFSRFYHHAMTTACAWLAWLWERIKERLPRGEWRGFFIYASFVLLAPLPMLVLPAIAANDPVSTHVVFFPARLQRGVDPCDPLPLSAYLDAHYGPRILIDVPYWQSSEFLYYTHLRVDFLANYPSHDHFIDNFHFFATFSDAEARSIARRHGFDLVAVCFSPSLYTPALPRDRQRFIALLQGGRPPGWLKPVLLDPRLNYALYAVDKKALEATQ